MTRIYLIRHGRTALNAQGRFRGLEDPPLDEMGLAEARWASARLAGAGLAIVYASPLQRALGTARIVAGLAGTPVEIARDLVDLDYGRWTGLTLEEAERVDPEGFALFRNDPERATPPGGEPVRRMADRVVRAIQRIAAQHAGAAAAAVSHELPIRFLIGRSRRSDGRSTWRVQVPTGSVTVIDVFPQSMEVLLRQEPPAAGPEEGG